MRIKIFYLYLYFIQKLTNLEELSFRMVLAFPKASKAGLAWMIWSSRVPLKNWGVQHSWTTSNQKEKGFNVTLNVSALKPSYQSLRPSSRLQLRCWQSTGWLSWCSQFSLHRILRCAYKQTGTELKLPVILKLESDETFWETYVMRTDWFSLSARFKTTFSYL